jgi:hypothetical protein
MTQPDDSDTAGKLLAATGTGDQTAAAQLFTLARPPPWRRAAVHRGAARDDHRGRHRSPRERPDRCPSSRTAIRPGRSGLR